MPPLKSDSEKKFSGNAQRRAKQFILHHGTVLYDFSITDIERYLAAPKNAPEYRGGRSHCDFLANISISKEDIKAKTRYSEGLSFKIVSFGYL